ncbi:hypothetical protein GCM10009087_51620 [Sphingomonas oligophenolica]|uniref:Uncharacterized protein n=1 Tax=Sphingomonas oligophenolica TaxID=301154 RepID=A0ABU9Y6S8_9SPHN
MKKRIGLHGAIALWMGIAATSAQAAEVAAAPCVTHAEASSLVIVAAPELIKAAGTACAQVLPQTALIRQTTGPYIGGFQAEAERAWPMAKAGINKIIAATDKGGAAPETHKLVAAMLDSDQIRPMLFAMIAPAVAKSIKPGDCAAIDHMMTQLAPLPPANLAEIIVTILELDSASKTAKGKPDNLPICPMVKP